MARIETYSYKNFQPRKPNHSFFNTEKLHLTGNSVSANNIWTIQPIRHDATCPTTKFEASTVNTEKLILNEERRPFFDDQYSWLRTTNFDPSSVSLAKYCGSGILAVDEVSCTYQNYFNFYPGIDGINSDSGLYDYWHSNVSSWWYEYQDKMYGNKIINWNNNRIALSKNVNGAIDYWTYKLDENDSDNDAIIVVLDGFGWGKQSFTDLTIVEGLRAYLDKAILELPEFQILGIQPSDVVFNPPLPITYHNPIATEGKVPYKNLFTVGATEIYPEFYFNMGNDLAIPLYSKDYEDENGKYRILQSCLPVEFVGVTQGGEALSATFPYSLYWNPTTGFQETAVNATERGVTPFIAVATHGNLIYQDITLDYGGKNIHRFQTAVYSNYEFNQSQYYNYDASVTVNGITVPVIASALLTQLFGNQGFFTYGYGGLLWADHRMNNIYLYSPESKKLISLKNQVATSATLKDGPTIPSNYVIDLSGVLSARIEVVIQNNVSSPNNYVIYSSNSPSGTNPEVKYFKYARYGDEDYPDSNKVCIIFERKNFGGLKNAAIGYFTILNTKHYSVVDAIRAPDILAGSIGNRFSSGTNAEPYKDCWESKLSENQTGQNHLAKLRESILGGSTVQSRVGNYYSPSGWIATQHFLIVANTKEEVIEKLDNFLETYDTPMYINPKDFIPDIVYNYEVPFKSGKIY